MKKFLAIAAVALGLLLGAAPVNAISRGGITVHDWKITSVRPTSFSSLDGSITLNITSERRRTVITEISGIIYSKSGEMFVIGTADDLTIAPGESQIVVTGHGSLPSYSVLLSILANPSLNPADYTADIAATVKTGRRKAHKVEMKAVPLSTFLK